LGIEFIKKDKHIPFVIFGFFRKTAKANRSIIQQLKVLIAVIHKNIIGKRKIQIYFEEHCSIYYLFYSSLRKLLDQIIFYKK